MHGYVELERFGEDGIHMYICTLFYDNLVKAGEHDEQYPY